MNTPEAGPAVDATVRPPPKLRARSGSQGIFWNLVFALAILGAMVVLYLFDPAKHGFYPQCALYHMTGLECPGCGGLRAAHQLLHGHLAAAWALNPLAVLLVPMFLWLGLDWALSVMGQRRLPMPKFSSRVAWICVAGLILFGVLRNF